MTRNMRPLDVFPITTRTLSVLRVTDVTTGMRRVTLGGPELAAHVATNGHPVAAFRSEGFDDEFKLILPHPDAEAIVGPTQAVGVLNWPRGNDHLLYRTYTVRRWDAERGELDVDFAQHGVGPATAWARRVQPGERVQIAGPKSSSPHPVGADWTLIAGDETALPAIGRWLAQWPAGARGQVFVETETAEHWQDLSSPSGVRLTWLSRQGAEAGTTSNLFDALRAAEWWEGVPFAWVAGETASVAPIRRWLRNEKGLEKEQVEVAGYWRRHEVIVSESDSMLPDMQASAATGDAFHDLTGLLSAFAVRVAASIGLAGALDAPRTVGGLIEATGADARGLSKLLRYLESLGLVESLGDGRLALTQLGRELEDEHEAADLDLDGLVAQRELSGALALLAAVRTGRGDAPRWFGAEHAERVLTEPRLLAAHVDQGVENADYTSGVLAAAAPIRGLRSLLVTGGGAGAQALALAEAHPELHLVVLGAPAELEAMRTVQEEHPRVTWRPGSALHAQWHEFDAVLLLDALTPLADADAIHVLERAAESVTRQGVVLVFGSILDPDRADEHDYEDDLVTFALSGGGARTVDEHLQVFDAAGLVVAEDLTLGWGSRLFVLASST